MLTCTCICTPASCGDSYVRSPLSIAPLFNYRLYFAYIIAPPVSGAYRPRWFNVYPASTELAHRKAEYRGGPGRVARGGDLYGSRIASRPRAIEAQSEPAGEAHACQHYQGLAPASWLPARPGTRTVLRDLRVNGLQLQDRLTLDEERILEALDLRFRAFLVSYDGHRWRAWRRDGTGGALRGLTPDDLAAGMRSSRTAR